MDCSLPSSYPDPCTACEDGHCRDVCIFRSVLPSNSPENYGLADRLFRSFQKDEIEKDLMAAESLEVRVATFHGYVYELEEREKNPVDGIEAKVQSTRKLLEDAIGELTKDRGEWVDKKRSLSQAMEEMSLLGDDVARAKYQTCNAKMLVRKLQKMKTELVNMNDVDYYARVGSIFEKYKTMNAELPYKGLPDIIVDPSIPKTLKQELIGLQDILPLPSGEGSSGKGSSGEGSSPEGSPGEAYSHLPAGPGSSRLPAGPGSSRLPAGQGSSRKRVRRTLK